MRLYCILELCTTCIMRNIMTCCTLLLCTSLTINMAVSSTTIQFPSSAQENFPPQQTSPTSNSTNSTTYGSRYGSYGESRPDFSSIRFQYDDNKGSGSAIRDNLIQKIIARGVIQFALQMDFALSSEAYVDIDDKTNVIFSPLSIAAALALVMLGAAGKTYTEIANVLGLAAGIDLSKSGDGMHYHFGRFIRKIEECSDVEKSTYISMAEAIFVHDDFPIKEKFVRLSTETYKSEVLNLDFVGHSNEARDVINKWVENKTHGHIPNILEYPPPPSTKVIIASALYFNGMWEYPFSPEQTAWRPFYVEGNRENGSSEVLKVVTMVNGADFPYYSDPALGCEVVGLPYKNHTATMYLVLPNEPGYQALKRLQHRLTVNHLQGLADSAEERTVIITVPRMQLESTIHLKEALKVLGVHTLFDPYQADLSQISDPRNNDSFMVTDRLGDRNMTQEQSTRADNIESTTEEYPANTTLITNISTDETPKNSIYQTHSVKQREIENAEFHSSDSDPNIKYRGLYADDVIHTVTVDVTETGTEAAAATVISVTRDGSHKVVRFERPFLFFIRHEATGSVLFWGTVVRPTPNQEVSSVKLR